MLALMLGYFSFANARLSVIMLHAPFAPLSVERHQRPSPGSLAQPLPVWRIETYCGVKMTQIGFLEFWEFLWRERHDLWRFLKWTGEMERYAHPKPKNL